MLWNVRFTGYQFQNMWIDLLLIGGGLDFVETKVIADRAYRWFILGDYSIKGEENDVLVDE